MLSKAIICSTCCVCNYLGSRQVKVLKLLTLARLFMHRERAREVLSYGQPRFDVGGESSVTGLALVY